MSEEANCLDEENIPRREGVVEYKPEVWDLVTKAHQ